MLRIASFLIGIGLICFGIAGLLGLTGAASVDPQMNAFEVWFIVGGFGVVAGSLMG